MNIKWHLSFEKGFLGLILVLVKHLYFISLRGRFLESFIANSQSNRDIFGQNSENFDKNTKDNKNITLNT